MDRGPQPLDRAGIRERVATKAEAGKERHDYKTADILVAIALCALV
jgi:hypothetical protein